MKIELDLDELVGLMLENHISIAEALQELHPEFMEVLYKRLKFLKDIQNAGRTDARPWFTQEELEEDRAMQLDASMRRSVNNLIKGESNE